MEKSLFTTEHAALLAVLREVRKAAGVTQVELAKRLGHGQSFVSKYERGDSRLDLIQLRTICKALGLTLFDFLVKFEERLKPGARRHGPAR